MDYEKNAVKHVVRVNVSVELSWLEYSDRSVHVCKSV